MYTIDWAVIQRMLIDAPSYETEEEKNKPKELKEQSTNDLIASLGRTFK